MKLSVAHVRAGRSKVGASLAGEKQGTVGRPRPMVLALFLAMVAATPRAVAALEISEYIEGTSLNKALEIWNKSTTSVTFGTDVDLVLQLYANGSATVSASVQLTPGFVLGPNEVFVIAHSQANAAILARADQTTIAAVNWNGDDAVVLRAGVSGSVIDSIGRIGEDPGSSWGTLGVSTADQTLRKEFEFRVDTNPTDDYEPANQFRSYPSDSTEDLGLAPVPEPAAFVFMANVALAGLLRRIRPGAGF